VNNAATLVFGEAAWQTVDQVAAQFTVNTLAPLQVFDIQTLCPFPWFGCQMENQL
jgi:hypothetical protein